MKLVWRKYYFSEEEHAGRFTAPAGNLGAVEYKLYYEASRSLPTRWEAGGPLHEFGTPWVCEILASPAAHAQLRGAREAWHWADERMVFNPQWNRWETPERYL